MEPAVRRGFAELSESIDNPNALESGNGQKQALATGSAEFGHGAVRAICLAPSFDRPQAASTKIAIAWDLQLRFASTSHGVPVATISDRERCKASVNPTPYHQSKPATS